MTSQASTDRSNERHDNATVLDVRELRKRFRSTIAVDGLNLTLYAGELVGLIGPNGAGKSTTIKLVTGQLLADEGTIAIGGQRIDEAPTQARKVTGYVPQELNLYPFLTGRETLEFVAAVHALSPDEASQTIDQLLARFELTEAQHRMTREYSEGMARKLSIAAALMGKPRLLVLDESLAGLDPRAASEVKQVLRDQLTTGCAILMVSHTLELLERLCHRIILIDRGKLVATLNRQELDELAVQGSTLEAFFLKHTQRD